MAEKMLLSQIYVSRKLAKVATAACQYNAYLPAVQTNGEMVGELRRKLDTIRPKEINLD